MQAHGVADFRLRLGDHFTQHTYTVADIKRDVIVGVDFLAEHRCEWRWSDNSLLVEGKSVPLEGSKSKPAVTELDPRESRPLGDDPLSAAVDLEEEDDSLLEGLPEVWDLNELGQEQQDDPKLGPVR